MNTLCLPITSLYRTLSDRHLPELQEVAKKHNIQSDHHVQKETLVTSVFEALLDMGRLLEVCFALDAETWELFQRASREPIVKLSGSLSHNFKRLVDLCYLECAESDEDRFVFVPDEIKALLSDLIAGGLAEQKAMLDTVYT